MQTRSVILAWNPTQASAVSHDLPAPLVFPLRRARRPLAFPRRRRSLLSQPPSPNGHNGDSVVEALAQSKVCLDFRQAFSEATGLPLALQPPGSWRLPHHGHRKENPFCALVAARSRTCVACLQSHERLWQGAMRGPKTMACMYGLCETAVPVHLDKEVIGFLHTGQAFREPPSAERFAGTRRLISRVAPDLDTKTAMAAWQDTPVLPPKKWDSLASLLNIFAQHLSLLSSQLAARTRHAEAPVITRVKEFIEANYGDHLSLGTAAKVAHASTFYFCKLFKKVTGVNFTDYVARVRIEKAKGLLFNPNLQVSEIAFEVGFQSLTHFNRVFKKHTTCSPSQYRSQLPIA
jgi:AraC-like DNA-binding protein/ligand-binding sensor protein